MKCRAAALSLLLAGGILATGRAVAQEAGPGPVALDFLRGLRGGNAVFSVTDTAIPEDLPEPRRADIATRLMRLGRAIRPDDLRVLEEKQDGELAAVLVSQITDYDPDSVQIHALGLVKDGDIWRPAPLPASFDLTGLSLRPGLRQRVDQLETWMLEARSRQFVRLRDNMHEQLLGEMRRSVTLDELHEAQPEKLAGDFLKAIAARQLAATLALTGGLESPLPPGWDATFRALTRLWRENEIRDPGWRALAAPEAVRAVVHADPGGDERVVTVMALDPTPEAGPLEPVAVGLNFTRTPAGLWRISLPEEMLKTPPGRGKRPRRPGDVEEPMDEKETAALQRDFAAKLAEALPPKAEPDLPAAANALASALDAPALSALVERLDLSGEPADALSTLNRAAWLWRYLHPADDRRQPLLLDLHEEGDEAVAVFQIFSAKLPAATRLEIFGFRRGESGWLLRPGFKVGEGPDDPIQKHAKALAARRTGNWSAGLNEEIAELAADSAPTEADARAAVEKWRAAAAAGDPLAMLRQSACFADDTGRERLLRTTGYELLSPAAAEILAVHRAGRWAAVSLRIPPREKEEAGAENYALHVVTATPGGPRVLAELDFFTATQRRRELLNLRLWDRVTARLPGDARTELESIYEKHRTLSLADLDRRNPSSE